MTRRSLLASLMALSLLCGGLGVASAADSTVHVDASTTPSNATEVYTTTGVNTLLADYGKKTDVETNKNDITALQTTTTDQGKQIAINTTNIANNKDAIAKKIDTETANATYATKDALNNLTNTVNGKANEADVNAKLANKADKTYVDTEVGKKANKATTLTGYGITDAYTKDATDTAITKKVNEEKDARELKDAELSGRIDTLSNTVDSKVSKIDLNTTLGNYYTQAETNAAIKTAVDDEKNARENAINGEVTSRNKAIADAIALEETNRNAAITKEETKRKEEDAKLEGKITENTTAINNEKAVREAADTDLSKRIGTVTEDGKYIKKSGTNNVSENLKVLDAQAKTNADNIQTNANNIKNNKDEIARVNGELVKTNNYFNTELGKTNDYFNTELSKTNNHFNTELGKTNAALQATNKRTAGIERTDTGVAADNQTVIEGKVHFDQNGNVSGVKDLQTDTIHATGEITSKGLNAGSGEITTTGKVSAGDVSTGTLETTGKATIGGDLTVNGKLNVDKISMKNDEHEATGKKHDSSTSITADGISNLAKVTDEKGNTTESQFTHNEKGTFNYAKDEKITGEWKGATSNVTADGVFNKMTDSDGNRHTYSQTATESKEQLVNGDKSKSNFEKKTAEGNTISIKDKDADGNKKSLTNTQTVDGEKTSVTNKESSSTIKQEADQIRYNVTSKDENKTSSSIEVKADGITNTSKDGTITNDAKDIVNNATGNMTNTVGGNQKNKIDGNQENTIGGNQTTTVTGDISNTAKNITNEANTKLTDKVGTNTRVLDSEGITDTVPGADGKGSTFKQRIDAIMGNVKTDAGESEVTQKGDEITSVVGKGEATNSRVTQKKGSLEAAVTDGTNTNVSYDVANASAKVLTDGTKENKLQDNLYSSEKTITNGTYKTSKLQTALDITNTAKNGTITNDAKNIVNNATGDMTNTVGGKLTTTVTGQVTENFNGGLDTNVTGTENHTVTGDQNIHVTGNQTTTVTGDISNTAKNITNEANTKLTDKVGTNTRVLDSEGITDTVPGADGKGSTFKQRIDAIMGNVKTDAGESEVTQKGDEITSVVGKGEATNSRVTQKKGSLEAAVTDGTNTNVSYDVANASAKVLTDGTKENKLQDNLYSSEKTITNGTYKTSKLQTALDITNTAKNGTITNDAKDIVNNASGNMTNTVGGDQTNTIGGNQTTTVIGDISNKAKNITNEASDSITDKVGDHTRVLDSDGITDTVGGSTFKQRIDKIMMESKNVSIKAEETLTNEAKVITNKASEVINNEAININNTATGIITSKASEIKNQADKLISNKVGENTWENMENGKITTSIKDGAKQNLTQSDAAGTTQSTVDGGKSTVTIQNADGLTDAVTDGRNTSMQNQTASQIAAAVKDGAGNENASVANATTSANTIKSGSKANTVISTADGTSFINSEAAASVTGASGAGTALNTTIKGNTITTGKVTMDYADVMKDLGVRGSAKVDQNLEVGGTSTLKGDVTMESNAKVKKDLTVEGTTTTKTLKVTENAEIDGTLKVAKKATFEDSVSIAKDLSVGGDVTANSYKVGDKTYISAAGINANDQKITNVADGSISEGSKDAVNGGQLYTVKNDLEGKVNKVGANAAAMANLHPMEFDPDSKWNIAAAIGNYGSETAAALGAFYRPNDDVMVNLSTAFGTGENMVGGGVSVRLGKSGNKLSREESNALKDQVNDLTARMDALLSVLNPNMSKDFPDVPENHWAYEAVSRLAGNDIVQGYPDGEFHGERTMTRYEMAEIIYNALSRGAEAERELVEEFKPELQAMAASEKATAERAEG